MTHSRRQNNVISRISAPLRRDVAIEIDSSGLPARNTAANSLGSALSYSERGSIEAASPRASRSASGESPRFSGRGSIEAASPRASRSASGESPRFSERGSIEAKMTCTNGTACLDLHASPSVAPLKLEVDVFLEHRVDISRLLRAWHR